MDPDSVEHMRNPPCEKLVIDNPDLCLSLDIFLAISHASNETYKLVRDAIIRSYPDLEILSLDQIKRCIARISGVIPIIHDMCPNTCIAYTGPFSDLSTCPECNEPCHDQLKLLHSGGQVKVARQTFHTLPVGPQLQAAWRSTEGSDQMSYRQRATKTIIEEVRRNGNKIDMDIYDDIFRGSDYITAVLEGKITSADMCLMFSIDGAQLYTLKVSDCWIYIWIVLERAPDQRYKKKYVLPGGFIPGPNKPKNLDSFIYPGMYHVAAVMMEGLLIWDAARDYKFISYLFLIFVMADTPGMSQVDGMVGHGGALGCRLYCGLRGRHKPNSSYYYPALLKPDNYFVQGCDHPDVSLHSLNASSVQIHERYAHCSDVTQ